MRLVSVIIPIYNCENNLDRCINSVLNQTYKNIELILVNDGSIDSSGDICDFYSKKDKRIKVIHQKNQGVSIARNNGVNIAKGYYIQFVDADDYIDKNDMIEKLTMAMEEGVDLVICGYKWVNEKKHSNKVIKKIPAEATYDERDFLLNFGELYNDVIISSPWNKLYLRKIIQKHNILFPENINIGEDLLFNLQYMYYCNKVKIIKDLLYNYMRRDSKSLTSKLKRIFLKIKKCSIKKLRNFLLLKNCYTDANEFFIGINYAKNIIGCFGNLFYVDSNLTPQERKEIIDKIINDETVTENIKYFRFGSIQIRIIGFLIKNSNTNIIYYFLKTKYFLKYRMNLIFNLLKKIMIIFDKRA